MTTNPLRADALRERLTNAFTEQDKATEDATKLEDRVDLALEVFSQISGNGWRDIESAPRDGTKFLAIGKTGYSVAFYRYEEWRDKTYFTVAHGEFYQSGAKFDPTHWKPLDPPPLPQPKTGDA
jgi:hypothetical protein